jgi:hypothetical protein
MTSDMIGTIDKRTAGVFSVPELTEGQIQNGWVGKTGN